MSSTSTDYPLFQRLKIGNIILAIITIILIIAVIRGLYSLVRRYQIKRELEKNCAIADTPYPIVPAAQGAQGYPPYNNANPEVVLFYSSSCGHSNNFLPEWNKFENNVKNNIPGVNVYKINCDDNDKISYCSEMGIKGYPTVMFHGQNGAHVTFKGNRTEAGLMRFLRQQQQSQ